jgi:hypothetical protein
MTVTLCTRCRAAPAIAVNLCRRCGLAEAEFERRRLHRAERRQQAQDRRASRQAMPARATSEEDAA